MHLARGRALRSYDSYLKSRHLDATEHEGRLAFLHAVKPGPANQSYGLQVASLAGVPGHVVRRARNYLATLESHQLALTQSPQAQLPLGAAADDIDESGDVIVAGHGRFGGIINRILLSAGVRTVVLDYQSEQLEMLRAFGVKVFFGDATRPDLLHAAGIEEAKMLVIAIDEKEHATELVRWSRIGAESSQKAMPITVK